MQTLSFMQELDLFALQCGGVGDFFGGKYVLDNIQKKYNSCNPSSTPSLICGYDRQTQWYKHTDISCEVPYFNELISVNQNSKFKNHQQLQNLFSFAFIVSSLPHMTSHFSLAFSEAHPTEYVRKKKSFSVLYLPVYELNVGLNNANVSCDLKTQSEKCGIFFFFLFKKIFRDGVINTIMLRNS